MSAPVRVQLRRTKGWRMPPNTVKVDRTTPWGNPFRVGETTFVWHRPGSARGWPLEPVYRDGFPVLDGAHSVRLFRTACEGRDDWYHDTWRLPTLRPLRGKNLACWCPLDQPCHADVLLRLANAPCDSGSDPQGEDAERSVAAEGEASQSGAPESAHRPDSAAQQQEGAAV